MAFLREGDEWAARERAQLQATFDTLIRETLFERFLHDLSPDGYDEIIAQMVDRNLSPWGAVEKLLEEK